MIQYLDLLKEVKDKGTITEPARKGLPETRSIFGYQFRHNLQYGFPLLTTKKMFWKGIVIELLWFLKGDTSIQYLLDHGVNIWNEDAYNFYLKKYKGDGSPYTYSEFIDKIKKADTVFESLDDYKLGDCGYQYGKLWRNFNGVGGHYNDKGEEVILKVDSDKAGIGGTRVFKQRWEQFKKSGKLGIIGDQGIEILHNSVDQISRLIDGLKNNPFSRRHILTAIDPTHDNELALYPCHCMSQFNVRHINNQYYLDCQLYQRSADSFLGVPFNIASYSLLTHIIAKICGYEVGDFIHSFGDLHIYENHIDAVNKQLERKPNKLPELNLSNDVNWEEVLNDGFNYNYIMEALEGYNPQPSIKAKLNTGLQ